MTRFGARSPISILFVVVLVAEFLGCGKSTTTTTPLPHSLRYEFAPSTGSQAVRGTLMSVSATVLDVPDDVTSVALSIGTKFERPDGVVDNSYLPGVETALERTAALPVTLECNFVVPVGTPEGNSFIPAGSRLLELWATIYMNTRSLRTLAGARAVYPVVG